MIQSKSMRLGGTKLALSAVIAAISLPLMAEPDLIEHRVHMPKLSVSDPLAAMSFSYSLVPPKIRRGGFATLSWNAENATHVNFEPSTVLLPAQSSLPVGPNADTTYIINAFNKNGEMMPNSIFLEVLAPEPTFAIEVQGATNGKFFVGDEVRLDYRTYHATSLTINGNDAPIDSGVFSETLTEVGNKTYTFRLTGDEIITEEFQDITVSAASNETCLTLKEQGKPSGMYFVGGGHYFCEMGREGGGWLRLTAADIKALPMTAHVRHGEYSLSNGKLYASDVEPEGAIDIRFDFTLPYEYYQIMMGPITITDASYGSGPHEGIEIEEDGDGNLSHYGWNSTSFAQFFPGYGDVVYGSIHDETPEFSHMARQTSQQKGWGATHMIHEEEQMEMTTFFKLDDSFSVRVIESDNPSVNVEHERVELLSGGAIYVRERFPNF